METLHANKFLCTIHRIESPGDHSIMSLLDIDRSILPVDYS